MTYSYNPEGAWTGTHQMSINGKRDTFKHEEFKICAKTSSIKRNRAEAILEEVQQAVLRWETFAAKSGVSNDIIDKIKRTNRLNIFRK